MAKSKMERKQSSGGSWITSFADLNSLLLTFFIMLYSSAATGNTVIFEAFSSFTGSKDFVSDSVNSSVINLGGSGSKEDNKSNSKNESEKLSQTETKVNNFEDKYMSALLDLNKKDSQIIKEELYNDLSNQGLTEDEINNTLEITATKDGVLIRIKDGILFDPGQVNLKSNVKKVLNSIGKSIDDNKKIRIEGNTDNVPSVSSQYKTNWELSTARSINVMNYLVENKFVKEVNCSVVGNGEFNPIANNDNDENKAKNRRVDIILLNT